MPAAPLHVIVLAAGEGKRMKSAKPKVMMPLARVDRLSKLLAVRTPRAALVTQLENPYGYGRVIRDGIGRVRAIVEEKDCTPEQRTISWVNSGILGADARRLRVWINNLTDDNSQHEYY